ncbi:hypothetical protein BT63DRAFT_369528 [Microthyrium microscopicum]|uniref:K Homology domain-containing protein n=1 Tax=Microthyrium microscopicum TaxID=703497 RepID=A0A6A6UKU1_9PEZI|nr:hypothetical protein BT63DRAFT_369528 [Microthyrium microscopicum]
MADSPSTATAQPSQKRPLEEPSSPSGAGEQPEAKRPALDKVIRDPTPEPDVSLPVNPMTGNEVPIKREDEPQPIPTHNGSSTAATQAGATQDLKAPIPVAGSNGITTMSTTSGAPQDESQWLHIRSIISSAEAATVIGKGGENVTLIRRMSGAKCTVSDYTRGAVERILTVSGPVDAVAKAFGLIIRTLNNETLEESSTPQSKTYPLRLLIPHILIGSIIGKGGVRIREIQDASGARLNASESPLPLSTERSLVVLGVADAVHIATYYVGSTLVEQLGERFGGPAASAYATRSGAPASVVPGGLQVVPYVPQAAGGQWGHPDNFRRHNNQGGQRTPANPYGMPYLHGQPPQAQQQVQAVAPYGPGSPRAVNMGNYSAAPQQAQQQYGHAASQVGQHAATPTQAMPNAVPGQAITQQIYIPNDMVGAIIGKGGAKINEIRQLSGSVIKINEPQDNSNERLVTITGTQECNQMALYMLYSRLGEFKQHNNAPVKTLDLMEGLTT